MKDCIFCEIVNGGEPTHVIWEDQNFLALLDIHPYREGHALLLPKEHLSNVYELPEPLYSEFFQGAKRLYRPIMKAVNSDGVGVTLETVNAARHLRIHLIPFNHADKAGLYGRMDVNSSQLEDIAERIRTEISSSNR